MSQPRRSWGSLWLKKTQEDWWTPACNVAQSTNLPQAPQRPRNQSIFLSLSFLQKYHSFTSMIHKFLTLMCMYMHAHGWWWWSCSGFISFFRFLFIFRKGKGEKKRQRKTSMCGCLLCTPHQGPGPQPRHVPWLGIEQATFWFTGRCSIHWTTPAREKWLDFLPSPFPLIAKSLGEGG